MGPGRQIVVHPVWEKIKGTELEANMKLAAKEKNKKP
jgi:hypothetical protein